MSNAGTFVRKDNGFVKIDLGPSSFNETCEHLGFHPDQLYNYSDYNDLSFYWVAYKIFTDEIVHVATTHDQLTADLIRRYTAKYSSNYEAGDIEDIFERGISNRSLTADYLASVLRLGHIDPNGTAVAPSIGYKLEFMDGQLAGFQPSDGLNQWARMIRESNPKLFSNYVTNMRKRGLREEVIVEEINAQGDAFATIPQGLLNPYIRLYTSPDGTIDFVALKAAHYDV
jgi:hypothetical protein